MKIVMPHATVLHSGLETEFMTPAQFIEMVGRTCYKSEDKITEDSAEKFVSGLIKRAHEAMIEHWTLIFRAPRTTFNLVRDNLWEFTQDISLDLPDINPHLRFTYDEDADRYILSGNIRAWRDFMRLAVAARGYLPAYLRGIVRDNALFFPEWVEWVPDKFVSDLLQPITVNDLVGRKEHSVHHDVTVKFICDRGVSHEFVRHREASFAQESTRYCNYSADKHGNEISVIMPYTLRKNDASKAAQASWTGANVASEAEYFSMLSEGSTPQDARSVLTNSLKTEVIITAPLGEWDHIFALRCAPDAHPDMQVSAKQAKAEFVKLFPERYA